MKPDFVTRLDEAALEALDLLYYMEWERELLDALCAELPWKR